MTRPTRLAMLMVGLGVLAAFQVGADAFPTSAIRLEVVVPKQVYLLAEPVDLYLTYTNVGSEPVEFLPRLEMDWDFVSCHVIRPDGKEMEFRPGVSGFPSPNARVHGMHLLPGESCLERANFTAGLVSVPWLNRYRTELDFTFDDPGEYRIRVTYHNDVDFAFAPTIWRGEVVSNEAVVRVEAPPEGERAAYEAWRQRTIMTYLAHFGTAHGPDKIAAFEEFLRDHPGSIYADYARVYLATCYAHINPHQPEKALVYYRDVLSAGKPECYLPEVQVAAAECHRFLGRLDDAKRICEAIIRGAERGTQSRPMQLARAMLTEIARDDKYAASTR